MNKEFNPSAREKEEKKSFNFALKNKSDRILLALANAKVERLRKALRFERKWYRKTLKFVAGISLLIGIIIGVIIGGVIF